MNKKFYLYEGRNKLRFWIRPQDMALEDMALSPFASTKIKLFWTTLKYKYKMHEHLMWTRAKRR